MNNNFEDRPWGYFVVLSDDKYAKVKRISVSPGHKLSYQMHNKRSEVWTIIQGGGYIILDGQEQRVEPGTVIHIKAGQKHRIANDHDLIPLVFIEVQHGSYFGEDDIVRFDDDYNRI